MAGGDGDNAEAEVISTGTGDDAQTVTILLGNLLVRGGDGAGSNSFARIFSPDGQIIVVGDGDVLGGSMTVRGGNGAGDGNFGEIVADGHQSITVEQGELLVAGGDGAGSDSYGAIIKTDVEGGFQEIDVQNNNMTVRGGTGAGTGNYGLVSSATDQVIDVSLVLSVLGGASLDNEAGIFAQDDQFITVANAGEAATGLLVESGDGQDADAYIDSEGVEQRIVLEQGNLVVRANQDDVNSSLARIFLDTDNSDPDTVQNIIVGFTVDGDGNLDVQNEGELQLFGGAGTGESAFISTNAQSQNVTAADAIRLTGGIAGSDDSRAIIGQMGAVGNQTVTVVSADVSGDITIDGGAGDDGLAGIIHVVGEGVQTINVANDLIIQGGDGNITLPAVNLPASALIGSTGDEQNITIANDLVVDGGAGDLAFALIEIVDGDQLILVGNDATLTGGTGTGAGAYILADGLQTVATARHLSINGGEGTTAIAGIEANDDQLILVGFEFDEVADDFVASGEVANLTLTGGDGEEAAAFIRGNSNTADAQRIILSDGDLTVQGNEDGANTDGMAFIDTTDADSGQYIEVNGDVGADRGNLFVLGGETEGDDAFISAAGTQEIITENAIVVTAGNDEALAYITSVDSQTITVGSNLVLTGGGDDSEAFIYSESTQNINVNGYVTVTGGTGEGADAYIESEDTQTIEIAGNTLIAFAGVNDVALGLLGGSDGTDGGDAWIRMTGETSDQTITVEDGNVVVAGGDGVNADAFIESNGLTQTLNVEDGSLTVRGGDGDDSDAYILGENTATENIVQTINVTNGGITVEGGTGENATAAINMLDADGQQSIHLITAGDLRVLGGVGENANAQILSEGQNAAGFDPDTGDGAAQLILVENGNLIVDAGDDANNNSDAIILFNGGEGTQFIDVRGDGAGTITVQGGAGDNETARIVSDGFDTANGLAQSIFAENGLDVIGGDGTNSFAGIEVGGSQGQQRIVVANNDLRVLGGEGENANATIFSAGENATAGVDPDTGEGAAQLILVENGNLVVDAGDDTNDNSSASIQQVNTGAATQYIDVRGAGAGTITVQGGAGDNEDAFISSSGFNAVDGLAQSIFAENGLDVIGGEGDSSVARIQATGGQGQQRIVVANNDLRVLGGAGDTASAQIQSGGQNAAGFDPDTGEGAAQLILVENGNLVVDAGDDTNDNSSASIQQVNTGAATQYIDVRGAGAGTITVQGGAGDNEDAFISSSGFNAVDGLAQSIFTENGLDVIGGDGQSSAGSIDAFGAQGQQRIVVANNDLRVLGGTGEPATAQILSAGQNAAGFDPDTGEGAAQWIRVENGNLLVDAGDDTDDNSLAYISMTNDGAATQYIDVRGAGAGTITVQGGAGENEDAFIASSGFNAISGLAQSIFAENGLDVIGGEGNVSSAFITAGGGNSQQRIVVANNDLQVLGGVGENADAFISASGQNAASFDPDTGEGAAQLILVENGNLLVDAGDDTNFDSDAFITMGNGGEATQYIDVRGAGAGTITVQGGASTNEAAMILSSGFNAADGLAQSIFAENGLSVIGGNGLGSIARIHASGSQGQQRIVVANNDLHVLGGEGIGAYASVDSSGLEQDITVINGNVVITGGEGLESAASIRMLNAGGDQVITSANGSIVMNDGTGVNADAVVSTANTQTLNALNGQINMNGINGNESLIESAETTVLNFGGGTWTGAANVTAGTSVTINNTGALVIDESVGGFDGVVTAPTLIFSGGQAMVGSTEDGPGGANTRLNTDVDTIQFDGVGSKTVNISEIGGGVALEGTVGTLDLITDDTGDITNSGPLSAVNVTLQTADGDINLDDAGNTVQNFRGVVVNGGSFTYNGAANVTIRARNDSAEIPAGEDIFASEEITIDVGGNTIFLAGGTKSGGTGPGAGDGEIFSGGDQTYESNIVLSSDYVITSDGSAGSDDIFFNGLLDGPGGLLIGSTPNFNNFVGSLTPLAYLVLNSDDSFFNMPDSGAGGPYAVTIGGDFINNGTMHLSALTATNYSFIVDANFAGPGPSIFDGGDMNLNNNSISIFAPTPEQVFGSALPLDEVFGAWTGVPFNLLVPYAASTIFYKAQPVTGEFKEEKRLRDDDDGRILVAYEGSNGNGRSAGEITNPSSRVSRELAASSYMLLAPYYEDFYFFGLETQAPVEGLDPGQQVTNN